MVKLKEIFKMEILDDLNKLQGKTITEMESWSDGGIFVTKDNCYLEYNIKLYRIPYEDNLYAVIEMTDTDKLRHKITNALLNRADEVFCYGALDYEKYVEYTETIVKQRKEKERLDIIEGKKAQIERLMKEIEQLENL